MKVENIPENHPEGMSGLKLAYIIVSFSFLGIMFFFIVICLWIKQKRKKENSVEQEARPSSKDREENEKHKSDLIENYFNSKISFFKDDDLETYDFTHSTERKFSRIN